MNEDTRNTASHADVGAETTGSGTGWAGGDSDMRPEAQVSFSVTLRDGATEEVVGADAYAQEQSMTTFFRTDGRQTVDCWSVRMASFRTDHILAVRRLDPAPAATAA